MSRRHACRRFPLPQVKNLYNLTRPYINSFYKYGTPEYDRETQELLDYGGQVSKRTAYQNDTAKFWLGEWPWRRNCTNLRRGWALEGDQSCKSETVKRYLHTARKTPCPVSATVASSSLIRITHALKLQDTLRPRTSCQACPFRYPLHQFAAALAHAHGCAPHQPRPP